MRWLALALSLLGLALVFVPGATARAAHGQKKACSSAPVHHAARRPAASRCVEHGARRRSHVLAKRRAPKKPQHAQASTQPVLLTPASCEDGSAPVRAGDGSFACADSSEPACEDGSIPVRASTGTTLLCPAKTPTTVSEEDAGACEQEAEGACPAASSPSCEGDSETCQAASVEESSG